MVGQDIFYTCLFVTAAFVGIITVMKASPVPSSDKIALASALASAEEKERDGRFNGYPFGGFGYQFGGGTGPATDVAQSRSLGGEFGYPYGN